MWVSLCVREWIETVSETVSTDFIDVSLCVREWIETYYNYYKDMFPKSPSA